MVFERPRCMVWLPYRWIQPGATKAMYTRQSHSRKSRKGTYLLDLRPVFALVVRHGCNQAPRKIIYMERDSSNYLSRHTCTDVQRLVEGAWQAVR